MSRENGDKLNRLEELKSKLFSKNYKNKTSSQDVFSPVHRRDVAESWQGEEETEANMSEKFFMKTSIFKKFFIFSVIFFILTSAYGAYVFFAGGNTVSNDNIEISVLGNNFTAGGEELPLVIGITNKNNSALDLVDLVLEYPKGSTADLFSDTEHLRQSLGSIPAGGVRNENLKVTLFGEQGSTRTIKISLEYRVAGSNAIFVKDKLYVVNINSTPINLQVDAPLSISPNQDVALNVKATLNATKAIPKILIKLDYPVGFQFVSSVPAPSFGNNVWNLGDLAPGSEHDIAISGKMVDVFDGEEKTFNVSSGSQSDADKSAIGVVFNSTKNTIMIKKPFVEASLFVNGTYQRQYAVDGKSEVSAEIRYANNLDTKIDDLVIKAKLSGNAFNRNTIKASQGFYDSSNNVITWDRNSQKQLRELNPGDTGSVSFSFSPLSLFGSNDGILSNPSINIEVDIAGSQSVEGSGINEIANSTSAVIKVISDVVFTPKILYYSGAFTNTGPIPPKVEQATTYTVVWSLSNTSNSISGAQVKSSLPSWVTFLGPISPASENLTYNSSTRGLVWNVDRIPKGTGITGAPRSVSFQVSLKPSLSQLSSSPVIINSAVLTGHDDFANVDVKVNKSSLNTRLDDDPLFPPNGGTVKN